MLGWSTRVEYYGGVLGCSARTHAGMSAGLPLTVAPRPIISSTVRFRSANGGASPVSPGVWCTVCLAAVRLLVEIKLIGCSDRDSWAEPPLPAPAPALTTAPVAVRIRGGELGCLDGAVLDRDTLRPP